MRCPTGEGEKRKIYLRYRVSNTFSYLINLNLMGVFISIDTGGHFMSAQIDVNVSREDG